MVRRELVVDEFGGLAVTGQCVVAAVHLGQLLLDDVGLDRDAEVIRLRSEIRRDVVIHAVHLEGVVAQVAPEHGEHTEVVGLLEGRCHFLDLARGLG